MKTYLNGKEIHEYDANALLATVKVQDESGASHVTSQRQYSPAEASAFVNDWKAARQTNLDAEEAGVLAEAQKGAAAIVQREANVKAAQEQAAKDALAEQVNASVKVAS
jgi:hypothetical protein